ncbi:MAG: ribonucleoside triphosphate reductase [Treponema sp.]|nr:ribonucleoside triphosphate reductase [Treponema sp.]MBQ1644703.1 ribonucleoside triphosphate reductase [Treponema sp.]MBQ1671334.1 ribonucleoside triphosphate reductase [Treponema sp.]MBQ2465489.1 ribonucleoside triphosphate reductase [Treponema sp.]MBQ2480809.1 ribonucleoside triphosphate reductase [Treponema sp.]
MDGADSAQSVFPEWKSFLGTSSDEEAKSFLKKVVKRSGEIENYDRKKIEKAVGKAVQAVEKIANPEKAERLTDAVEEQLRLLLAGRRAHSIPAIEEIQDVVETVLIQSGEVEIAKAYILYRAKHEAMRDAKKLAVDINKTMDGYLSQSDWRVHENANINFSLGGLILHNSGTITANYWLRNIYPKEIADAHINCAFHIHDLSMFSGYCAGWSLRQLIKEGLGGVKEKITCAPAAHLSTLVNQMVNFLGILQNEWAGAQAFSSFDTYLAPFVKADSLSEKEVRQCIQSFIFGVNTPSRWGSQAPFTNITLDWTCPEDLRNQKAVVAGKETDFTYGDCQKEMDVINKVFIELMLKGDDAGRGFAYPIPTYNITKDFDWENPNCALLFQMTSQYGTPYFQNFINSDLNPSDVRSMCCRLRLDKRELKKRGGGLFGSDEFTGSLGVVTINLPQIGFLAKSAQNPSGEFYRRLDHLMDLARDSLQIKRKVIQKLLDGGLFPYTRRYLKTLDNHFNTIGLCGMNECCLNLLGKDITTSEGKDFACKVLDHMRERMADYQEKTGELFNLEATPAESTSYRLARHDKENFPGIITSGKDDPFYTNSSQLPVDFTSDIFEALDHQEALQTRYTGGTVFHIFVGEQVKDWRACKELIKTVFTNYRIPYITVSPVYSVCKKHGYIPGEHFECPKCKAEKEAALRQKLALLQTQKQELIQKQKLA